VLRRGRGEPLLLVHGLGGSSRIWEPVIDLLAPEREAIALDLPGFGEAPPLAAGTEATAANLTAALRERCLELGIERPHVAGNSLGGWVALEAGRAGWAASVTALSPAGLWPSALGARRASTRVWAMRLRPLVWLALHSRRAREAALATFAAKPQRIPAAIGRRLILDWVDAPGYDDANHAMRTGLFDPAGYPPEVPVTIAWCERDRLVGPPKRERRPAHSRFLVLPDVGHTPTWDDPELVASTLLDGSARLSSPA
jgi:pimeloyl-ACP methyl ester carboxylesterase